MYRRPRAGRILARRVAVVAPGDRKTHSKEDIMAASQTPGGDPIKVGVITDQTGPLSVIGLANANVARMVVGDINAKGGLLGRHLELHLEDSATDDSVAAAKATKLVEQDHVDVIFGGIYSSTRQAIKGPAVVEGKTARCPRSRSIRSSRG
jgi:ABC-type branched-subunit amino acid transport system substrate-binding protein